MNNKIVFDVMIGDRFYCTERMPITPDIVTWSETEGKPSYDMDKIRAWVEHRRPTLKHEKYQIYID